MPDNPPPMPSQGPPPHRPGHTPRDAPPAPPGPPPVAEHACDDDSTPSPAGPAGSGASPDADAVAPDRTAAASGPKSFPCKQCGAELTFDPAASALTCPYCGLANPIPRSAEDIHELDFHAHLARLADSEQTLSAAMVHCDSCGAETTLEEGVTADACPFCGSAVIARTTQKSLIRPRSLLPFAIDRDQAFAAFRRWVKGLWFAPGGIKKFARTDLSSLQGVYVPYWTYDAYTISFYTGQRGDDYQTTETYTTTENGKSVTKTRTVTRTRWRHVSGTVYVPFDDVLVLASRSLPRTYADRLEPWDLDNLEGFDERYLSGFKAERYQVDLEEGFERAKETMDRHIRRAIERDIGGDHQRIHSVRTQHDNVTFKHLLLPVWISTYRFRDKPYRFLVNARTGEVQGERPWCAWKIALAVLAALAAIAAIVYFVTQR